MDTTDNVAHAAAKIPSKKRKAVASPGSAVPPCYTGLPYTDEAAPLSVPALESIKTTSDDQLDEIVTLLRKYVMRRLLVCFQTVLVYLLHSRRQL